MPNVLLLSLHILFLSSGNFLLFMMVINIEVNGLKLI